MRKKDFWLPLSMLLLWVGALAQTRGTVQESLSFASKILKKDVRYTVYLPADYGNSTRRYPVVYLLHGYSGHENDWVQYGEVNRAMDKATAAGDVPDAIIVMPDGENHWYINNVDGSVRYEDFFVTEFVPHIDQTFRTRADRGNRAVAGLSMGGQGALVLALKHPELFSACAGLSSAVWDDEELAKMNDGMYDRFFASIFGKNLKGKDRINEHWQKNTAFHLVAKASLEDLKKVRWYFDNGDDDFIYRGNALLHVALREKNVPHEFRMRDGAHNWTYWRTGITDALKFIGESFKH